MARPGRIKGFKIFGRGEIRVFDQNIYQCRGVKVDGSVLEEKPSFKMLMLTFSSKLDWGSYIISITKITSKKIGALICSMKFFSPKLLCISINLPYGHNGILLSCLGWCS